MHRKENDAHPGQNRRRQGSYPRRRVTLSENALLLNGERVPLFSGEIHFWRIDPQYWGECLKRMKAMGLKIVSTYLSWRRHSISPQERDLTGKNDPRLNVPAFLRLCQSLGLWVHLKPGPWICAEEEKGGYPDWLLSDEEILAKDNHGQPVVGYSPPFDGYTPSYLHPTYLKHVRRWLTDVDLCISDFCYPRGPVILVQLDNEPSMTFRDGMFESDYNPVITGGLYQQWLKGKYGSVEALNLAYRSTLADFSDVEAPVTLGIQHLGGLRRHTDWAEFKEWLLARYIQILRDIHLRNGIGNVLFTVNYNRHWPLSVPNNWSKLEEASGGLGGYDYYAVPPLCVDDFVDVVKSVNYSLATSKLPWAPEMMTGIWKLEGSEETPSPLLVSHTETMPLLGLAYGLKGMNFYMFVNRENWQGAPVDERGQPSETYDVSKRVMSLVRRTGGFASLRKSQDVAVMYYRPYAWEAYVVGNSKVSVDGMELGRAYRLFERSYAALLAVGYDPAIVDPFVDGDTDISTYRLLVVPSSGYMDEQTQRLLHSYVEGGGIMVFCPVLPIMDLDFKPCGHFGRDVEYAGVTPRPRSPFGERVLGRGKIILVQDHWLSDEGRDEKACDPDVLGSLLASQGLVPEVGFDDRHITGVIHSSELERILFVVDTIPKPREVHLAFRDITTGSLQEILPGDAVVAVRRGVGTLATEGVTVRVFRVSEQI